jgi:hypothetical protein
VGSSGVVAFNMKRRFLGFDQEPAYVTAAAQRFEQVCSLKAVPIGSGEAQPFLLTASPLKIAQNRESLVFVK